MVKYIHSQIWFKDTYLFIQLKILVDFVESLLLEKHTPDFEDLEQLDDVFSLARFPIVGLLPNKTKQEANLVLEEGDVVSLHILDNGVDDIYELHISALFLHTQIEN
jgi:hypothetical protein